MSTREQYEGNEDVGNSQSGNSTKAISVFQPGAKELFLKEGELIRVLPAFNKGINRADEAYSTGWLPCRSNVNGPDGNPQFNSFFVQLDGYRFFGQDGLTFLSPQTFIRINPDIARTDPDRIKDPIRIVSKWVYEKEGVDAVKAKITKVIQGKPRETSVYPMLEQFNLLNALSVGKDDLAIKRQGPIVLARSSLEYFQKLLLLQRGAKQELVDPRDPYADTYLLGDPTAPNQGMVFNVLKKKLGTGAALSTCLEPCEKLDNIPKIHVRFCPVTAEVLAKRHRLLSSATIYIPQPQEIVDILLIGQRSYLPKDTVRKALDGHNFNLHTNMASGAGPDPLGDHNQGQESEYDDNQPRAPEPTSPAFQPPPPLVASSAPATAQVTPALSAPEQVLWISVNYAPATQMKRSEIVVLVNRPENAKLPISLCDDAGAWADIEQSPFGIVRKVTPVAPPPPPAPVTPVAPPPPPAPPKPPAPPAPPVAPAAPAAPKPAPVTATAPQPTTAGGSDWLSALSAADLATGAALLDQVTASTSKEDLLKRMTERDYQVICGGMFLSGQGKITPEISIEVDAAMGKI